MESSGCLTGNGLWVQFSPSGSLDSEDDSDLSPKGKLREGKEHRYTESTSQFTRDQAGKVHDGHGGYMQHDQAGLPESRGVGWVIVGDIRGGHRS